MSKLGGKLEGKIAVVTGGASGIGEGIARRLVADGARVVIGDISDDEGEAVADSLDEDALYRHCDVTSDDEVAALVQGAAKDFGRLDIMINNAGAIGARGSILDITVDEWDATINLLLRSTFLGMRHAGRILVDQGEGGSIINTASIAAHAPGNGPHVYGTAKAGVVHLTQRVALELGEHRIRVNAICPGGIVTPLVLGAVGVGPEEAGAIAEVIAAVRPYPRAGRPADVAATAAWLVSDDGEFVTGQAITVDGGESVGPKWSDQMVT
ncbi:MAG: glucose 1-dehydrogenase [Acidimicrobiia bacterium]|nr:glucose 1-dehydrogenase [Acidimicrobiia bacterium]